MNKQQEKTVLSIEEIRSLKKSAHHLKPVIQVGKKGVSEGLIKEIEQALADHELIKIQFLPVQKPDMDAAILAIVSQSGSTHVATVGNVLILFKAKEEGSAFFN